jgi:hypothetical protein
MERSEGEFLQKMAHRYCWDAMDTRVVAPDRIVRRVMDLGILDDALSLQPLFGRERLVDILRTAPPGSMRPRSWWFWHYRLGLADATHDPPPMPSRRFD